MLRDYKFTIEDEDHEALNVSSVENWENEQGLTVGTIPPQAWSVRIPSFMNATESKLVRIPKDKRTLTYRYQESGHTSNNPKRNMTHLERERHQWSHMKMAKRKTKKMTSKKREAYEGDDVKMEKTTIEEDD
ncbi:hypothetical protein L3X38_042041 [Prunus dulcis]|uniref:Uncharacterized protein n=1 Tax=Prunus dulcis TaxID=3755 RepID=A0AAD4UVT5_PRUDU|nr:hypothetical protein L3X38_042041 [Prunus dulcis]